MGTASISTARATDTVITLTSSAPAKASVPATVTIPAGQTSAAFVLTVPDDTISDGARLVTVSATAPGDTIRTASIVIADNDAGVLAMNMPATAGETGGTLQSTLTVAPVTSGELTVSLTSSNPGAATVPSSILLAPGQARRIRPLPFSMITRSTGRRRRRSPNRCRLDARDGESDDHGQLTVFAVAVRVLRDQ